MIYYVGAGSNLGERVEHLSRARLELQKSFRLRATAPLLETPPLLPPNGADAWYKPFLNTVFAVETDRDPQAVLEILKHMENICGRTKAERWAPRVLDLDILCTDQNTSFTSDTLKIPHSGLSARDFALVPLVHLNSALKVGERSALQILRSQVQNVPYLMGILNCTPDSFSNAAEDEPILERFKSLLQTHVAFIDLGAESTRPGASAVSPQEEIERLRPVLEYWFSEKDNHPWTQASIDTRHAETARFALDHGVTMLNDVAHLSSPALRELASDFEHIVFMHSLTVPADNSVTMKSSNVTRDLYQWCESKLEEFHQLPAHKLIFDPGIGFGKTPVQSMRVLSELEAFSTLPVRLLVGHSRKSFMNLWTTTPYRDRDAQTLGLSLALLHKPVNILRVHNVPLHQQALLSHQCGQKSL